jgi:hypothetical protein
MSNSSAARTWAILRASWHTVARNPRLLWFTALLGFASLVVTSIAGALAMFGVDAAPWSVARGFAPAELAVQWRAGIGFGLVMWLGSALVMPFFGVALADATLEALAARPFGVRRSLGRARGRVASIATYAVLDASVGAMLARMRGDGRRGRRRGGHPLFAKVLGLGWWFATYLVLPVLAREPQGGVAAVGRSAGLMRQTWKEAFVGRLLLRWAVLPFVLVGVAGFALLLAAGITPTAQPIWFGLAAVAAVSLGTVLVAVMRTLDAVYRCALYVFATEGVVPEPFDEPALHEIWATRPTPDASPS